MESESHKMGLYKYKVCSGELRRYGIWRLVKWVKTLDGCNLVSFGRILVFLVPRGSSEAGERPEAQFGRNFWILCVLEQADGVL